MKDISKVTCVGSGSLEGNRGLEAAAGGPRRVKFWVCSRRVVKATGCCRLVRTLPKQSAQKKREIGMVVSRVRGKRWK